MSDADHLTDVVREWSKTFMKRSMRDFKQFMEENDLSFTQVNILMLIFYGNKSGVSQIGESMGVTNAAASQAIDRLVNMDLIIRSEDPSDRRAKKLKLTRKGMDIIDKGVDVRSRWIENLTEKLSQDDQDLITSALTILTDAAKDVEF